MTVKNIFDEIPSELPEELFAEWKGKQVSARRD